MKLAKPFAVCMLSFGALIGSLGFMSAARFDNAIQEATQPIQQHLEGAGFAGAQGGAEGVRDAIITIVQKVVIPALIIVAVIIVIVGMYEVMTSEKEDDQKKWFTYILRWVVGIIIMFSAAFIANRLVGAQGVLDFTGAFQGNTAARKLYDLIIFPFLKMVMYIVIGMLFLVLLIHFYRFLVSPDEKIKEHSKTILIWNSIGVLLIIFAKSLTETIYGKQTDVINPNATSLADIGTGILADKSFGWLYVVLNRTMGLIGFAVLVIIIIEAVTLLTQPTDEKQIEKLKKNFLYVIIGIVIIGTAYAVTNFVVLQ